MQEQLCALEMGEELVPEPGTFRGTFDQARHVGDRELPRIRPVDDSEDRLDRREGIVGDLRLRVRDAAKERGFAGIGETGERGIDHELEPQDEIDLVARKPGFREAWRLPGRRRKAGVPAPTLPSASSDEARTLSRQIGDEPPFDVEHLRPDRNANLDRLPVGAVLLGAASVAAPSRAQTLHPLEGRQVAKCAVGDHDDVPATPAVAAVGTPLGTNFSRRKLRPPSPPRPASAWMCARS